MISLVVESQYRLRSPLTPLQLVSKENKVVLFMKGVPQQPMCGFSKAVVQILELHGV